MKSEYRQRTRKEWEAASTDERVLRLRRAAEEVATPRHASAKLWPDIIARLTCNDALALVEEIDNAKVRDALILHALNA